MNAGDRMAIHPAVLRDLDGLRARFQSGSPLPRWVTIPDFLAPEALDAALAECRLAELATFCGYLPTADASVVRNAFCEPNEDHVYVTVHERCVKPLPGLARLGEALATPSTVRALSEMTGLELSASDGDVLTCWGPWSFIQPHDDVGDPDQPARLVISLSLTTRWDARHGGVTVWACEGTGRAVRLEPRLNNAVLFAPAPGALHWVEQVAGEAPRRTRFTWTLRYL